MENFRKIALGFTLFFALIAGLRIYLIHKERTDAGTPPAAAAPRYHLSQDDMVSPRQLYPTTMKDVQPLVHTTVWVNAGGQLAFYPYTGHAIDFAHSGGFLLGADELHVQSFITAVAPASAESRIPRGNKQVFMIFTRPRDDKKLFAAPVGFVDGGGYTFYLDKIFFYDDIHVLYKHWSAPVWAAVMQHQVILGMNERQAQLALGQVASSASTDVGNRTVKYYNLGHPINVTFEHDKATLIQPTNF